MLLYFIYNNKDELKEKEIITAQSFDEHKLVITSFVAKRNVYSEY